MELDRLQLRLLVTAVAATVTVCLAGYWEFEQVDSGSLGAYVAIDKMHDGTIWLAYVNHDSAIRLAYKNTVWAYEDLDTALVRPPFSFDIGHGDVIGVVGLGRLAEFRDSVWSFEELPMSMRDLAFSYDSACRPSLTFKDSLWQGCFGLKTDSGWDTNVVFQPSEYTREFSLSRPAWRRNDNCAFMEADVWSMSGLIDGYGVGLLMRDSGTWKDSAFVLGLDGWGSGFAALVDSSDSIHTLWSAWDPYGTNRLVCDGVSLDSETDVGAACLDDSGRVQCAWIRSSQLKFAIPGRETWVVQGTGNPVGCDITTDTLAQPVIAYHRQDGSIWIAHGVGIVGLSEEPREPVVHSLQRMPTIVTGVLFLPARGEGQVAKGELMDISGRKVFNLRTGANDVSALAPGVYFVRERGGASSEQTGVRRIVVVK